MGKNKKISAEVDDVWINSASIYTRSVINNSSTEVMLDAKALDIEFVLLFVLLNK